MNKPLTLVLAALAALGSVAGSIAAMPQGPEKMEGKKMPAFTMKDTNGKTITDKSLKGKVVLVDFWATWCPPCVAASPTMNKLHAKYAKQGLVILGANVSDRPGAAVKYKNEHKYAYTFTTGGEKLANSLGVRGIPAFFFVDRKGVIQDVQTGFGPELEKQFEGTVKRLLAAK
jgi:thiol-disulfide isomerase/thioredoxin